MARVQLRDGQRQHYYDIGRKQIGGQPAPVCVLLHGFAMPGFLWLPFITPLANRYRFIVPDIRGFGASHQLQLNQADVLDQFADDLEDLLEHLNLNDVVLAGLSMGACTSMQYLHRYGTGRVRAYLNIDQSPVILNSQEWPWGLMGPNQAERFEMMLALHRDLDAAGRGQEFFSLPKPIRHRLWGALSTFFGEAFTKQGWKRFTRMARHEMLIRHAAPMANWNVYMDILMAYAHQGYDWRKVISELDIPMTAMVGMRSDMYPAAGQLKLAELNPGVEIVKFEQAGHAIPFETPRQFQREFAKFLGQRFPRSELSKTKPRTRLLRRLVAQPREI